MILHKDNKRSHIPKRVGIHEGNKVIFTDEANAIAEYVPSDISLTSLSAEVGVCLAYRLAMMSSTLIVGKGAAALKKDVREMYILHKHEAQEKDRLENMNYYDESIDSEFVDVRTS